MQNIFIYLRIIKALTTLALKKYLRVFNEADKVHRCSLNLPQYSNAQAKGTVIKLCSAKYRDMQNIFQFAQISSNILSWKLIE